VRERWRRTAPQPSPCQPGESERWPAELGLDAWDLSMMGTTGEAWSAVQPNLPRQVRVATPEQALRPRCCNGQPR